MTGAAPMTKDEPVALTLEQIENLRERLNPWASTILLRKGEVNALCNLAAASLRAERLWLWRNFVDGKPEYWAFDNPYPCELGGGDPLTLGEPCGYAIVKPSTRGRTDVSDEQVIETIRRVLRPSATQEEIDMPGVHPRCTFPLCKCSGTTAGGGKCPLERPAPPSAQERERLAEKLLKLKHSVSAQTNWVAVLKTELDAIIAALQGKGWMRMAKRFKKQRDCVADVLRAADPNHPALEGIPSPEQQLNNLLRICEEPDIPQDYAELRSSLDAKYPHVGGVAAEIAYSSPLEIPSLLDNDTADLVKDFANALLQKLAAAKEKYGHTNGWKSPDWMDECREQLIAHVAKGDPRDVAAYCAFLWYHGEETAALRSPEGKESGWISVEERLPEGDDAVLGSNGKFREIASAGYVRRMTGIFTHWMPLPAAPRSQT